MKTIRTETIVDAPPQDVWKALMDFDRYPAWNPFVVNIAGNQEVGQTLSVTVQPAGRKPMTFRPKVVTVERGSRFRWRGNFLSAVLFSGEHGFAVEEVSPGRTRFIHDEVFRGLLVPVVGGLLKDTHTSFSKMNDALKSRVEAEVTVGAPAGAAPTGVHPRSRA